MRHRLLYLAIHGMYMSWYVYVNTCQAQHQQLANVFDSRADSYHKQYTASKRTETIGIICTITTRYQACFQQKITMSKMIGILLLVKELQNNYALLISVLCQASMDVRL